jgi:hypothetical protein
MHSYATAATAAGAPSFTAGLVVVHKSIYARLSSPSPWPSSSNCPAPAPNQCSPHVCHEPMVAPNRCDKLHRTTLDRPMLAQDSDHLTFTQCLLAVPVCVCVCMLNVRPSRKHATHSPCAGFSSWYVSRHGGPMLSRLSAARICRHRHGVDASKHLSQNSTSGFSPWPKQWLASSPAIGPRWSQASPGCIYPA